MKGRCLCGKVEFTLALDAINVYQCYCSLCRKQSGTESNLATIVAEADLAFSADAQDHITTWVKESGFTSHFCKTCGSPVPNKLRTTPYYWVPVGLLEGAIDATIVSHIYIDSKQHLDVATPIEEHSSFPDGGIQGHIHKIAGI